LTSGDVLERCCNRPSSGQMRHGRKLMIDEELLKIMCCPACRGDVVEQKGKIVCSKCGRKYPIRDGIPVMLIDEAEMPEGKE